MQFFKQLHACTCIVPSLLLCTNKRDWSNVSGLVAFVPEGDALQWILSGPHPLNTAAGKGVSTGYTLSWNTSTVEEEEGVDPGGSAEAPSLSWRGAPALLGWGVVRLEIATSAAAPSTGGGLVTVTEAADTIETTAAGLSRRELIKTDKQKQICKGSQGLT